jgi:hypothetical protein
MTRRTSALALATAAALAIFATPAWAESGRLADFSFRLSSTTPGTPTGFHTQFRLRKEGDPDAKPTPIRSAVLELPSGLRYDTGAIPECMATDEELHARGSDACPPETQLTLGTFSAITGFGPPVDPVAGDNHVFNAPSQLIEVITVPGGSPSPGFDRLTIKGTTLTAHPPMTPGGPPDGETAVRGSDFNVPVRGTAARPLVTTPPECPAGGQWKTTGTFVFSNGDRDTVVSATPCAARASAPSKLRLSVRPGRVRAGRAMRFTFRVRSAAPRCVAGARVHFAGRWLRTDASGRAAFSATLHRRGIHRARVSHLGCGHASARVRVRRAR